MYGVGLGLVLLGILEPFFDHGYESLNGVFKPREIGEVIDRPHESPIGISISHRVLVLKLLVRLRSFFEDEGVELADQFVVVIHHALILEVISGKVPRESESLLSYAVFPGRFVLKWYRWWDSNPHGVCAPTDFKSVASAISPHRHLFKDQEESGTPGGN